MYLEESTNLGRCQILLQSLYDTLGINVVKMIFKNGYSINDLARLLESEVGLSYSNKSPLKRGEISYCCCGVCFQFFGKLQLGFEPQHRFANV